MDLGIAGVAAITVIAYVIGLLVKATRLNNKWIPIICAVSGAVLGIAGLFVSPAQQETALRLLEVYLNSL